MMAGRQRTLKLVSVAAAVAMATLAACGSPSDGSVAPPADEATSAVASASAVPAEEPSAEVSASQAPTSETVAFMDGLEATVTLPAAPAGPVPLVVMIPGGGWQIVDVDSVTPLADDLAARGAAVVTITYRIASDGAYFPVPVEDVACGVAFAFQEVGGMEVSEVVVAGHSAGGHMAALVALTPEKFATADCPYEAVAPDAFIGLAGPYDDDQLSVSTACNLFSCDVADQKAWDGGNPIALADQRPEIPALLVHGTLDDTVYPSVTGEFADALTAGGHDVSMELIDGASHGTVTQPEVVGAVIGEWLGRSGSMS